MAARVASGIFALMPSDWNDDDRRAFKRIAVWGGTLLTLAILRGVIVETQNAVAVIGLSVLWIVIAISAVIWSLRHRKPKK